MGGGMGGTPTDTTSPTAGASTTALNTALPAGVPAGALPSWMNNLTPEQIGQAQALLSSNSPSGTAVANLGFPTATPTQFNAPTTPGGDMQHIGFTHTPYPTGTGDLPHIGAPDAPAPAAAAAAAGPAEDPNARV